MANCVTCKANCISEGQRRVNTNCTSYVPKDYPKPPTNADRIRAMTDEELAKIIGDSVLCSECPVFEGHYCSRRTNECHAVWLNWLKQEVDDGT